MGKGMESQDTPLLGGQRVSNPLTSGLEHQKRVCSSARSRESTGASPLPPSSAWEPGDDGGAAQPFPLPSTVHVPRGYKMKYTDTQSTTLH